MNRERLHGTYIGPEGRYFVTEYINKGTYSYVYAAIDRFTSETVAIKCGRYHQEDNIRYEYDLLEWLRQYDTTSESNILFPYGCFKQDHCYYIVFPLLDGDYGHSSRKGVRHRSYSFATLRVIARTLAKTFSFLRNHHVIHGDLKPDNIGFLRVGPRRWRIRVFDFGLAQYATEGSELRIQTLNYRSPEVVLGICPYNDAIDMWSTGCVLWEMKLGRPLFQCSYVHQLVQQFIDVLGHPPEWMLDAGTQTYSFFRRFRRHSSSSSSKYGLDTSSQYPSASSRRSLQPQLCCTCRSQGDLGHLDCVTFYDLVSRLVCYDPHKRLLPKDILTHPFMLLHDHRYRGTMTRRLPKRRVSLSDFRFGSSSSLSALRSTTTIIRSTKHGKRHKRSSSSESRDS